MNGPENTVAALTGVNATRTGPGSVKVVARLDDRWRIVYAQGGAVMAATLEGALAAVARDDLQLVSAATTFHRPLACGPVALDVTVLRSSRSSAQVMVELRTLGTDEVGAAATTTAVLAIEQPGWPDLVGAPRPSVLAGRPDPNGRRLGVFDPDGASLAPFFDQTEWRDAPAVSAAGLVWHGWCRFARPPAPGGPWATALLAVPADALGCSVVPSVRKDDAPVFALSMQMSLHVLGTATGGWLGVESRGLHVAAGIATGLTTLWDEDGAPEAVSTQTALLREMPSS